MLFGIVWLKELHTYGRPVAVTEMGYIDSE